MHTFETFFRKEKDLVLKATREVEQHPDLHTSETDIVVRKTRHSAFIRTDLEDTLLSRAIDTVVLLGFSTNACVGLTATEAYERAFKIVLADDAILGTNQNEAV